MLPQTPPVATPADVPADESPRADATTDTTDPAIRGPIVETAGLPPVAGVTTHQPVAGSDGPRSQMDLDELTEGRHRAAE